MPEVERLAARREIERLSTLKFFQAVSSQCFKLAGLQITDFQPDSQLLSMLAPLNPGDQATFRGAEWEVIRAEDPATVHSMRFDAQSADMIPMLHILMDQGSIGCAANAFSLDQNLLVHYSYDKIHRLHRDYQRAAQRTTPQKCPPNDVHVDPELQALRLWRLLLRETGRSRKLFAVQQRGQAFPILNIVEFIIDKPILSSCTSARKAKSSTSTRLALLSSFT